MKVAIMQPYFFPYIGYWQLINTVDKFVIYDNIKYTKKGWINRNQILVNNDAKMFTVPIQKDSDFLDVNQRFISDSWDKSKMLNLIKSSYSKSPQYKKVIPLIEKCLLVEEENLFNFLYVNLTNILDFLEIKTDIIISSTLDIDHNLKSQDRVIATCKKLGATQYINPQGGINLYNKLDFEKNRIDLKFLFSDQIVYKQYSDRFLPWLSIIDILMFNDITTIKNFLQQFTLQ
jgi:hypothetical protein